MKQTKPFGRAYLPTPPQQDAAADDATQNPTESFAGATLAPTVELFSLRATDVPLMAARRPDPLKRAVRDAMVATVVLPIVFLAYVAMRDSMVLAKMLEKMTTAETVMVCEDGKMVYADFSVTDRLLNRGSFMCTDWRIQSGYLSIPKR